MRQGRKPFQDFRDAAAEQSEQFVSRTRLVNLLDSESSLCLRVNGRAGSGSGGGGDNSGALYRIALVPWVWLAVAACVFIFGLIVAVLILTPALDATLGSVALAVGGIVLGAILIVMSAGAGDGVFEGVMESRLGTRLIDLKKRIDERVPFCVEDPATYQKLKIISEDYATGGVDHRKPGLLMEGLRYRYVVRPNDVTEIRQVNDYLLITYTVGTAMVTLALNVPVGDHDREHKVLESIKETLARRGAA